MITILTDFRSHLLRYLHAFILALLASSLVIVLIAGPADTQQKRIYVLLILFLFVINGISMFFRARGHYYLAAAGVILMALFGPWGSYLLDPAVGNTDLFPLMYVTVPIMLSSLLLPLWITLVLSVSQLSALSMIIFSSEVYEKINWASCLTLVIIISVISIAVSYIITEQVRQLKASTIHDHLSGLFNRWYLDTTLEAKIHRSVHHGSSIGLIMIDIDDFKNLNDSYGHLAGDYVIRKVGSLLSDEVSLADTVCRYGGDEFAIIVPDTDEQKLGSQTLSVIELIRSTRFEYDKGPLPEIHVSAGYALYPLQAANRSDLISKADSALLEAKRMGKDQAAAYRKLY